MFFLQVPLLLRQELPAHRLESNAQIRVQAFEELQSADVSAHLTTG